MIEGSVFSKQVARRERKARCPSRVTLRNTVKHLVPYQEPNPEQWLHRQAFNPETTTIASSLYFQANQTFEN